MRRRAHLLSCERRAVVPPRRRKYRHLPGRRCSLTCSTHASEFTPTCQECEEWWSASWLRSGHGRYKKRATEVEVQDDSVETGACRSHPNDEGKSKQLEALAKAVQLLRDAELPPTLTTSLETEIECRRTQKMEEGPGHKRQRTHWTQHSSQWEEADPRRGHRTW